MIFDNDYFVVNTVPVNMYLQQIMSKQNVSSAFNTIVLLINWKKFHQERLINIMLNKEILAD